MAQNTKPVFPKVPKIAWATLTTANTAMDGTGTVATIFTADATNGSRVDKLKIRSLGTNVATVLRVFLNNGSTNGTAANNTLYTEITIAATTASNVAALADNEIAIDLPVPAAYKVNVAIGTTVAAGVAVAAVGGDY